MRTKIILTLTLILSGTIYSVWRTGEGLREGSWQMLALCVFGCTLVGYICINIRLWFDKLMFQIRFKKQRKQLNNVKELPEKVYETYLKTTSDPVQQSIVIDVNIINTVRKILEQLEYNKDEINQMITNALNNNNTFNTADELLQFILKGKNE